MKKRSIRIKGWKKKDGYMGNTGDRKRRGGGCNGFRRSDAGRGETAQRIGVGKQDGQ